jgi:NADH-quinone oxidoreductase subunit L
MFLGLGVGAYSSSVFHVTTHAFFKALLFLGAGSVIHAMGGEQDMRKMGGLWKHLPITGKVMAIGTLAISGFPLLSGFFSKDEILAHTYEHSPTLWFFGQVASILTAFYMFRLLFLTFFGKFRGTHEQEHHLHESPKSMTIPLIVLAIFSIFGGVLGLPEFWGTTNWFHHHLDSIIVHKNPSILNHAKEWTLMIIATLAALATIFFAYMVYIKNQILPEANDLKLTGIRKLIYNKYYVDELYEMVITKPLDILSEVFYKFLDLQVVDGIVNGVGSAVTGFSTLVRKVQTGHIGFYIFGMVLGIIAILFFTFIK